MANEIKIGNNYQKSIWHTCDKCGKERWVRLVRGQPRDRFCSKSCSCGDSRIEKICLNCGKGYKVYSYRVKEGTGNYCSRACYGMSEERLIAYSGNQHPMWNGGKIKRICRECGLEFEVFPFKIKNREGIFCSCSCHMINQRKQGMFCQTPNKVEKKLLEFINQNKLPFRYTGNGEVWLGNRNPDFINTNGKKQVIELLGTYWHPLFDGAQRKEHYRQYGYACLTIWEDELINPNKVIRKLRTFAR